MPAYVEKPQPLLTSRVEFTLVPAPAPSSIASRIEFTDARLLCEREDRQITSRASASPPPEPLRRNSRNNDKIMKPRGEPGRPNSGGYSVEAVLKAGGWARDDVEALMVGQEAVRDAAREKLDIKKSYRSQDKAALKSIGEDMAKDSKWPKLKDYENCWPVQSILKLTLKYNAEAARRSTCKDASQRLIAALRGNSPVPGR
ncbi:hypothetical protein FPV67DRAFT_1450684 [Lyophyllum atratum]|nr:hypothetical protein FPV67DRAFT_1454558 [Lyophyllum atratum]KAF8065419.1 hypothetical protein FPV67DRAFT_1451179 [Lyophyllum atratum]KAF8066066.1 hypothetical protein FPV67DRAFT_1450684 [Lyophyllum atratum]